MIAALVKVALSMFDQKEYKQFDKGLIKACIKSLMALAGVHSLKYFIPGETRENKAIRDLFIKNGGLSVLLLAEQEQDYREEIHQFLSNMNLNDWEAQLSALNQQPAPSSTKLTASTVSNGKDASGEVSNTLEVHRKRLIGLVEAYIEEEKEKITRRDKEAK